MPNVMVALPNVGGALCSTPQRLADTHYFTAVQYAAKTRRPLKFRGVPQTGQPISAASRPKFTILWGHVEDILLLNIFSDCDTCLRCVDRALQSCAMVPKLAIFGDFFASCVFSELRAAGFRHASEIRTKATPCVEVWQASNLRQLRLGEEKQERRKK